MIFDSMENLTKNNTNIFISLQIRCKINLLKKELNRVAISSPYAPYIPTAAAPAAGNAAAIKGAPNAGRTKPCLSITFVSFRDILSTAKSSLTEKAESKSYE